MREVSKVEKYIEALKGISYFEWIKLREGMDNEFNRLIGESKRKLELTDVERVEKLSVHNLDKHRVDSPIIPFGLWGTVLGFIITAESILIAFDSGSITSEFKKTGHYVTVIFQYTQTSIKLLITILILVVISVIDKFSMKIFGIFIGLTVMNFVDVLISLGILYLMMRMASS